MFNSKKKVADVRSIFDELHIPRHAEEALEHYYNIAMKMLDAISMSAEKRLMLTDLTESLRVRVS